MRTNARDASSQDLLEELSRLKKKYEELKHRAMSRVCYSLLETGLPEPLRILQGIYVRDLEKILTDDGELYSRISEEVSAEKEDFWSLSRQRLL